MDSLSYGFTMGIGFWLACLVIVVAVVIVGLMVLFIDYLRTNKKDDKKNLVGDEEIGGDLR